MPEDIEISVSTRYIGEEIHQDELIHIFSYTVDILNKSEESFTLRNRYWLITNADGEKVEVSGQGVVGKQPTLGPDEDFQYSSASMLKTPVGVMEGYYEFEREDGSMFKAPIAPFSLARANSLH